MPMASVDNLVLTGFMGTGKSAVGRKLAERLQMGFIDTDEIIESRHGAIERIFADRGEEAFREVERELAKELSQRKSVVIATGGRMMLDAANAEELSRNGRVFCLTASPEEIHRRISSDETRRKRPLLSVDDPQQRIVELMSERQGGYARFHQISTDHRDPEAIADEIERVWKSELEGDSP
jgi:shikimate kinase